MEDWPFWSAHTDTPVEHALHRLDGNKMRPVRQNCRKVAMAYDTPLPGALLMRVWQPMLLLAALACRPAWAQSCFEDVCLGQGVGEVAQLSWNRAQRRQLDPGWVAEWLSTTRYVGPEDALREFAGLSTFDGATVLVLNRLQGVCGPGLGPRLKRGEQTDDNLIVDIEPVPAEDGLSQRFEVVEINAYLRRDRAENAERLKQLCHALIPPGAPLSAAAAECEAGRARQQTADGAALISISVTDVGFTRINIQPLGGWFDQRDPDALARLPACSIRRAQRR